MTVMQTIVWGIGACGAALLLGSAACNALVGIDHGLPLEDEAAASSAASGTASSSGMPPVCPAEPCYTGPAETRGKGACKDGTPACDAEGNPTGACEGEVLPSAEVCSGEAVVDEDCDGAADEGGVCAEYVLTATGGIDHTCALLHGGRVKCWGFNDDGQLGLGDKVTRGDEPNEMGAALPFVDLGAGEEAKAIASGRQHTCALLQGGRVKCWGWNALSQLGLGDTVDRGNTPASTPEKLPPVSLGLEITADSITSGEHASCAVLSGGSLKCWGSNNRGELGLGDTNTRGDGPNEMGDNLPFVPVF
jgi:hypothetical protein